MRSQTTTKATVITYRGLTIKINHPHDHYQFCFYVYLDPTRFTNKTVANKLWLRDTDKWWRTDKLPYIIQDLPWPGGITFYAKHLGANKYRSVEIGCDYGHLWDMERGYSTTLEDVITHSKHVVDKLHESTEYLVQCRGDGRLVSDYEITENGYSKGYLEKI